MYSKGGLFDPVEYIYNSNWRDADKVVWNQARWQNGMQAAHNHVVELERKLYVVIGTVRLVMLIMKIKAENLKMIPTLVLTMARALLHWMPALHFQKK